MKDIPVTQEDGKNIAEFALEHGEKVKIGAYTYHEYTTHFTESHAVRRIKAINKNPGYTVIMKETGRGKFAIYVRRKGAKK
jgi:hypothetical protein